MISMDKNFFMTSYIDGSTVFHRLNPILKIPIGLIFFLAIFTQKNFISLGTILLAIFFMSIWVGLQKKHFKKILKIARTFAFFSIFTALLRPNVGDGFQLLIFHFSTENAIYAMLLTLRIFTLILTFHVFIATTHPLRVVSSIEHMQTKPFFKKMKLDQFSFICLLALYFIPSVFQSFQQFKINQIPQKPQSKRHLMKNALQNATQILPTVFLGLLTQAEWVSKEIDQSSYKTFLNQHFSPSTQPPQKRAL